jgi:hypothetical protein
MQKAEKSRNTVRLWLIAIVAITLVLGVVGLLGRTTPVKAAGDATPAAQPSTVPEPPSRAAAEERAAEPPTIEDRFDRAAADFSAVKDILSGLTQLQAKQAGQCQEALERMDGIVPALAAPEAQAVACLRKMTACKCQQVGGAIAGQVSLAKEVAENGSAIAGLREVYEKVSELEAANSEYLSTLDEKSGPYLKEVKERSDKLRADALRELQKMAPHGRT